jgi:site-specific DNA-methyltransferase (adenine-specific)
MPMKSHEDIVVFGKKGVNYYPQFWYSTPYKIKPFLRKNITTGLGKRPSVSAAEFHCGTDHSDGRRFPLSILTFKRDTPILHNTQKPVKLCEYLINTYTKEGELVLDSCAGSGTTAVACINTKRKYICMEMDKEIYEVCKERVGAAAHP